MAVYDFDVHHGNGTSDIFFEDPSVLFISTHQAGELDAGLLDAGLLDAGLLDAEVRQSRRGRLQ